MLTAISTSQKKNFDVRNFLLKLRHPKRRKDKHSGNNREEEFRRPKRRNVDIFGERASAHSNFDIMWIPSAGENLRGIFFSDSSLRTGTRGT
jgi:hypothetical protein